ncbi:hypothetical protein T440DRAFT_484210 [Plenodomus tracheiphilus IPT5]|uniref:Aminoglycoside phosphotransferase domain-containing protein n=1 Tax=Plenodomus tracheiphilus IPT5 TaxID=1408161 RepID=A0A6A7ANU6_9PLEO|nr:hypothetical protein T440DRAFT_484210 [Plenodomus tracheiphilus IPT5]
MHTFQPESLVAAISTLRSDGEIPVLNERHWDGGQCRIFKVDFSNRESWSVRIPIHVQSESQDTIINILQGERCILQELGRTGFPWAPKYYGSSLTFDNLVGFPFMALSWIEGSPLVWTPTDPPRPIRDKVLRQVAKIQMALIECTKESKSTATQYFSRLAANRLHRVRSGNLPGITVQNCFDQETLLEQVLNPELEHAPFAIDHGDLAPLNIIVDSKYNITGVIDWGFASKVPVQLAGRLPRILQLSKLVLPPNSTLQEDRKAYTAALESQPSQAAFWMLLILSSQDVDFRHCVLESTISKGMHLSLARLGWNLPYDEQ